MERVYIGIDENGLGAQLGPLVVTAVAANLDASSNQRRNAEVPARFAHLLDDSKRLVSHKNVRLGEAWARAIVGPGVELPSTLLEGIGLDPIALSMSHCPRHVQQQCWSTRREAFTAPTELVDEVQTCLSHLQSRGLSICLIRSSWSCTRILNDKLATGVHRFLLDLHSMERLVLHIRERLGKRVDAVCGKVGGIADYPRYFGPLSGRLFTVIEQQRQRSTYEFSNLGRISFEQDADANDTLVMIASLIGKYVRELFMSRIARHYEAADEGRPSGYHDPVTARFMDATAILRKSRRVPFDCFERRRAGDD